MKFISIIVLVCIVVVAIVIRSIHKAIWPKPEEDDELKDKMPHDAALEQGRAKRFSSQQTKTANT